MTLLIMTIVGLFPTTPITMCTNGLTPRRLQVSRRRLHQVFLLASVIEWTGMDTGRLKRVGGHDEGKEKSYSKEGSLPTRASNRALQLRNASERKRMKRSREVV